MAETVFKINFPKAECAASLGNLSYDGLAPLSFIRKTLQISSHRKVMHTDYTSFEKEKENKFTTLKGAFLVF